jgi:GDP-L-fucose synthase|tara:strand:+ start:3840 stop:4793 length:954 start_codon:yes stop_codon:yes gene_type:complete
MLKKSSKIYVPGHNGLVGKAIHDLLLKSGYKNVLLKKRKELDLTNEKKVDYFFKKNKPEFLIICAARVGGILENETFPMEFLLDNFSIQKNLLLAAKKYKVKRVVFLGSSCIYPKISKTPIKEDYLMTGKLEKTNESYALSKIMGIKLCEILHDKFKKDIICLMPTNLYGENDNFDISSSHVIPGLITKFLQAKKKKTNVKIWGTGKPIREFLHVEDLAQAIFRILKLNKIQIKKINKNKLPILNVGSGESLTIKKLALMIKKISKFKGKVFFDKTFPDGTINKNLDSSKIKKFNWAPKIKLSLGLKNIIESRQKLF